MAVSVSRLLEEESPRGVSVSALLAEPPPPQGVSVSELLRDGEPSGVSVSALLAVNDSPLSVPQPLTPWEAYKGGAAGLGRAGLQALGGAGSAIQTALGIVPETVGSLMSSVGLPSMDIRPEEVKRGDVRGLKATAATGEQFLDAPAALLFAVRDAARTIPQGLGRSIEVFNETLSEAMQGATQEERRATLDKLAGITEETGGITGFIKRVAQDPFVWLGPGAARALSRLGTTGKLASLAIGEIPVRPATSRAAVDAVREPVRAFPRLVEDVPRVDVAEVREAARALRDAPSDAPPRYTVAPAEAAVEGADVADVASRRLAYREAERGILPRTQPGAEDIPERPVFRKPTPAEAYDIGRQEERAALEAGQISDLRAKSATLRQAISENKEVKEDLLAYTREATQGLEKTEKNKSLATLTGRIVNAGGAGVDPNKIQADMKSIISDIDVVAERGRVRQNTRALKKKLSQIVKEETPLAQEYKDEARRLRSELFSREAEGAKSPIMQMDSYELEVLSRRVDDLETAGKLKRDLNLSQIDASAKAVGDRAVDDAVARKSGVMQIIDDATLIRDRNISELGQGTYDAVKKPLDFANHRLLKWTYDEVEMPLAKLIERAQIYEALPQNIWLGSRRATRSDKIGMYAAIQSMKADLSIARKKPVSTLDVEKFLIERRGAPAAVAGRAAPRDRSRRLRGTARVPTHQTRCVPRSGAGWSARAMSLPCGCARYCGHRG